MMYNSKSDAKFRFHIYSFDSLSQQPGDELLPVEIMLPVDKKFGWLRFDLSQYNIALNERKFFIGFEWIEDQKTRTEMIRGLQEFDDWKKAEFKRGNPKVNYLEDDAGNRTTALKYYGNMMDWPGFKNLPPFTGLMIETGKSDESKKYRTFERKTSFGEWKEQRSTLNAVLTITY